MEASPSAKGKGGPPLTGKGKGISAKADGANMTGKIPAWKAKLQAAEDAKKAWLEFSVKKLPAGPLTAPQWGTAFATELPESGTNGCVFFLATFAGAYCIKGVLGGDSNAMGGPGEYAGNIINVRLGVNTPPCRIVYRDDEEFSAIKGALLKGGAAMAARGLCGEVCAASQRINTLFDHERLALMVCTMISDASMFGFRPNLARQLFELPDGGGAMATGDEDSWAAPTNYIFSHLAMSRGEKPDLTIPIPANLTPSTKWRLQSLGRAHAADIFLSNKDRFFSPFSSNSPVWSSALPHTVEAWTDTISMPDGCAKSCSKQAYAEFLFGNTDNMLMQHANDPLLASPFFIDNMANAKPTMDEDDGIRNPDVAKDYFIRFLEEAASGGGPLTAPITHVEFMRYLVRGTSGYVLHDAALREIRIGALHVLGEFLRSDESGDFRTWLETALLEMEAAEARNGIVPWAASARPELLRVVDGIREVCEAHRSLLQSLPPAATPLAPPSLAAEYFEPGSETPNEADVQSCGITAAVWKAVPLEARTALRSELAVAAAQK